MIEIETLKQICNKLAKNIELNQGQGGNISIKSKDKKTMAIKASGATLEEVTKKNSYVLLNNDKVKEIYEKENLEEKEARKKIDESMITKKEGLRPSIETGFHSFLPKIVIHLHPLFLISILATTNAKERIKELLKKTPYKNNYTIIPYKKPGHKLSKEIYKQRKEKKETEIYLLENHGLIVASENEEKAMNTTLHIIQKAKEYIKKQTQGLNKHYTQPIHILPQGYIGEKKRYETYLFPDAAVFLEEAKTKTINNKKRILYTKTLEEAKKIDEVIYAHNEINRITRELGNTKTLTKKEVQELFEMEEEKYRKKQT